MPKPAIAEEESLPRRKEFDTDHVVPAAAKEATVNQKDATTTADDSISRQNSEIENGSSESESDADIDHIQPMSPNAMVEAAFQVGVQNRKKRDADRISRSSGDHENDDNGTRRQADTPDLEIHDHVDTADIEEDDDEDDRGGRSFNFKRSRVSRKDLDSLAVHGHAVTDMATAGGNDVTDGVLGDESKLSMVQLGNCNYDSSLWLGLEDQLSKIWTRSDTELNDSYNNDKDNVDCDCDYDENKNKNEKLGYRMEVAESSLHETKQLILNQFDHILKNGLEAFHQNDDLKREYAQLKELCDCRGKEVSRLKASEDDLRSSLSNLLRAVETSKASTRDVARAAQTESRLRNDLSSLRSAKDVALGECAESNRQNALLKEEVRLLKARVARLTQDKIKVERDSRAALSLARSMDTHAASDVDYYKRKVSDLNDHLQSKTAEITELKHQVHEYRRQMERSISQNRLAQIRSEGVGGSHTLKNSYRSSRRR